MRERERESGGARVFCEVYLSIFFFFGLVRIEIFFGEGFKWIFFFRVGERGEGLSRLRLLSLKSPLAV